MVLLFQRHVMRQHMALHDLGNICSMRKLGALLATCHLCCTVANMCEGGRAALVMQQVVITNGWS